MDWFFGLNKCRVTGWCPFTECQLCQGNVLKYSAYDYERCTREKNAYGMSSEEFRNVLKDAKATQQQIHRTMTHQDADKLQTEFFSKYPACRI